MRYSAVAAGLYFCMFSAGAADGRLAELAYDKNQVFQIKVKRNIATRIVLEPGEHIISSATGFPSDCKKEDADWCVVAKVGDDTLFVKPKNRAQGTNNLELTTDKRIYSLELVTVKDATGELANYRVDFRYPDARPGTVAAGPWQWDYTMQQLPGSTALAPSLAFDDGHQTRLKFPIKAELPAIFAVDPNGTESRLPLRIDDEGFVVLDSVVADLVLRQGPHAVRIWKGRPGT